MAYMEFIETLHRSTARDYVGRVNEGPKAEFAKVAKEFGRDYWDGDRHYGYGGYTYDGRWKPVAERIIGHYGLQNGDKVLDVGCGKAHLLYEMKQILPDLDIRGIDVSEYGITHTLPEIQPYLEPGRAQDMDFPENSFDLVMSFNALHNLYIYDLVKALKAIEKCAKKSYICVESYRNEEEKVNLLYWQLTCESFFKVEEWEWIYNEVGYTGDYGFIFFT